MDSSGDFVQLSDGLCHYQMDGPSAGPVVLLIHGATVPAWEFDRLVPYLTSAGLRTLRADLYGHGCSDRPRARYEHTLFVRQLCELLDGLAIDRPVRVLGHSLGAAIGARLVCQRPERFSGLVLTAPMLSFTDNLKAARVLNLPLLGELLMSLYVLPMLVRRRGRRYRHIEDGRFAGKFKRQLQRPGFGRALLSLFRSGSLGDQSDCYRTLGRHAHPVLVLRGLEDRIVTPGQIDRLRDLMPRARFCGVGGTAHAFVLTHPQKVAPLVIDFFAQTTEAEALRAEALSLRPARVRAPNPTG